MTFKMIIFDLDGTLVDSLSDITHALNHAILSIGYDAKTTDEVKTLVGGGISALISKILKEKDRNLRDETVRRFLEYYNEHIVDNTKVYPGVRETLDTLRNYKKVVITNKREMTARKVLEKLDLSDYFAKVYGSDTIDEKKPSPAPLLKALSEFGFCLSEALIVGDGEPDIEAGKAAGVKTVGVTYGYRERNKLLGADELIDHIGLLPGIIETLS